MGWILLRVRDSAASLVDVGVEIPDPGEVMGVVDFA